MTKEDYELIAKLLARTSRFLTPGMALVQRVEFANELSLHNPRFNKIKFVAACVSGKETKTND